MKVCSLCFLSSKVLFRIELALIGLTTSGQDVSAPICGEIAPMRLVAFALHMAGASMVIAPGTCLQLGAHTPEAASAVHAFLHENVTFRTLCVEQFGGE